MQIKIIVITKGYMHHIQIAAFQKWHVCHGMDKSVTNYAFRYRLSNFCQPSNIYMIKLRHVMHTTMFCGPIVYYSNPRVTIV